MEIAGKKAWLRVQQLKLTNFTQELKSLLTPTQFNTIMNRVGRVKEAAHRQLLAKHSKKLESARTRATKNQATTFSSSSSASPTTTHHHVE